MDRSRRRCQADGQRAGARQIHFIAGDYWGAYLVDYLGAGRFQAAVHVPVRFVGENATVNAADPREVAFIYQDGQVPHLRMPADRYQMMNLGPFDLYVPVGRETWTLSAIVCSCVSRCCGVGQSQVRLSCGVRTGRRRVNLEPQPRRGR